MENAVSSSSAQGYLTVRGEKVVIGWEEKLDDAFEWSKVVINWEENLDDKVVIF